MKTRQSLFARRPVLIGATLLAILTAGVYYSTGSSASKPDGSAPPAIPVTVQTMAEQPVRIWTEFSGRLMAVDYAEIRPQVSGRITEIRFEDGQTVKKNDILLVIDPRTYQAAVDSASATAQFSQKEESRAEEMIKSQAIAQRIYDQRKNENRVAQAALKQAKLDLEHAYVRAPISGRVSRAEITVGNLVQTGAGAPLLTTIVSDNGIYADFDVDEQTYMQTIRQAVNSSEQERSIPVELITQGNTETIYHGNIHSFDNHIDPASGTIRARAKFDNQDGLLVPGMFVKVKLAGGSESNSLLVPEKALGFDQNKTYVYTVGADNKVVYREVVLGKQVDGQRVVLTGLKSGDRVIIEGVQHVRPDAIVDAKELAAASQEAVPAATKQD